jgi:uncharacterized membrane protein
MNQTFAVDPRIPVSSDVSQKDPSHPNNVIRNLKATESQAVMDAKYDTIPPERTFENFENRYSIHTYLIVFIAILIILYGVYTSTLSSGSNSKQSFKFFFFVFIIMGIFLFATRFIRLL